MQRLGLDIAETGAGVVRFRAGALDGARAALALRSAPRVVVELARGFAADRETYFESIAAQCWEELLPPRLPWAVRAVGVSPALRNTRFTAQLAKDAIRERFAAAGATCPPVNPVAPAVVIAVRIERGAASVGLDLGGASLHTRRGPAGGPAPLREDVAAGLALLAGARADEPLFDPFCGGGTLISEAAAIALGRRPQRDLRRLALAHLPLFQSVSLAEIARELDSRPAPEHPPFLGFDRDARAVAEARAVVARAGLAGHVAIEQASTPDVPLPLLAPGLLLSNPPWGRRLAVEDARAAWRGLGELARTRLGGWRFGLLSGDPEATRALGLKAERRWRVFVGGVDARFLIYRVHA